MKDSPEGPAQPDSGERKELRAFLQVVADVVAVKAAQSAAPGPATLPEPVKPSVSGRRTRVRFVVALCTVALLAITVLLVRDWRPEAGDLPATLQGRWHTSAAEFAGRELGLAPDSITFSAGAGVPAQTYPILFHRAEREAGEEAYRIEYVTDEGPFTIRVRVQGDELRLLSRADIPWFRAAPDLSPRP